MRWKRDCDIDTIKSGMNKNRLEAFSDGVLAIIITIMVLELKVPHETSWSALLENYPVFLSYLLSFIFVGLYWTNHHQLYNFVEIISPQILWLNLNGLFWQSLIPFASAWMGENHFESATVSLYAGILTMSVLSTIISVIYLRKVHGVDSEFSKKFKTEYRSFITLGMNILSTIIALLDFPLVAFGILCLTALLWFIPYHKVLTTADYNEKQISDEN